MGKKIIDTIISTPDYGLIMLKFQGVTFAVKIDKEDIPKASKYHWAIRKHHTGKLFYAHNSSGLALHRYLTDCPKNMVVDHINHDTLDNRKCNLRICTVEENNNNRRKYSNVNTDIGLQGISVQYRVRVAGHKARAFNNLEKAKQYYYSIRGANV